MLLSLLCFAAQLFASLLEFVLVHLLPSLLERAAHVPDGSADQITHDRPAGYVLGNGGRRGGRYSRRCIVVVAARW